MSLHCMLMDGRVLVLWLLVELMLVQWSVQIREDETTVLESTGATYWMTNKKLNWGQSLDACLNDNGTLAVSDSEDVGAFLKTMLIDNSNDYIDSEYWIGLNGEINPGIYIWSNGRVMYKSMFKPDEPDNKIFVDKYEDCIMMTGTNSGYWKDAYCYQQRKAICQSFPDGDESKFYCNASEPSCVPWMQLGGMEKDVKSDYSSSQPKANVKRTLMNKESCEKACTTSVQIQCRAAVFNEGTKLCSLFIFPEDVNKGPPLSDGYRFFRKINTAHKRPTEKYIIEKVPYELQMTSAIDTCKRKKKRLLTIYDEEKENSLMGKDLEGIWLGLSDKKSEGVFIWEDDTSFPFYHRWDEGYPNGARAHNCVFRNHLNVWQDVDCTSSKKFACEYEVKEACKVLGNPCKNGGMCEPTDEGDVQCVCSEGFTGKFCDTKAMKLCGSRCLNNATCQNDGASFICLCATGFNGVFCETKVSCSPNPCENGATCIEDGEDYKCNCIEGYIGMQCEEEIMKACAEFGSSCLNNATCQDDDANFTCLCATGFTGEFCDVKVPCLPNPCENGATCIEDGEDYKCNCIEGFIGMQCEVDYSNDPCRPNPCLHGRCEVKDEMGAQENTEEEDVSMNVTCSCNNGFTGSICETNIDECYSNPCMNEGVCKDRIDRYFCDCTWQYYGLLCENDVGTGNKIFQREFLAGPCGLYPCQNGGKCQSESLDSYECICPRDYYGQNCEEMHVLVYTYIMLRFEIDYIEDFKSMMSDASRKFKSAIMKDINKALIDGFDHAQFANVILIRKGSVIVTLEVASSEEEKSLNKSQIELTARKAILPVVFDGVVGVSPDIYPVDPTSVNITVTGTDKDNCLYVHDPCKNGGVCYDAVGYYFCMCTFFYTGQYCEHETGIQGYGKGQQSIYARQTSNKTRDALTAGSPGKQECLLLLLVCLSWTLCPRFI